MNFVKKITAVFLGMLLIQVAGFAFAPTNFFELYNPNLYLYKDVQKNLRVGMSFEYGLTKSGKTYGSGRANVLQLHDEAESVLAMFDTPTTSREDDLTAALGVAALPDTNFAKVKFAGSFQQSTTGVNAEYRLPLEILSGTTNVSLCLPIHQMRITDVSCTDLTDQTRLVAGAADTTFHTTYLASVDTLKTTAAIRGDNLDFSAWNKVGVGDLVVSAMWDRFFKEDKPLLRGVDIYVRAGFLLPTGTEKNIDKAFSMPLGHDGAFGIPMGLGIGLNYIKQLKIGVDVSFLALLDETKEYRMKNALNQTDFLLFKKGRATKSHGFEWTFNLYTQAIHFVGGVSFKCGYEYTKHDNDTLTPRDNNFDATIVNSSNSLLEWNKQSLVFQLNWDAFAVKSDAKLRPQLSFFYKLPVHGKNIIDPNTFGGQLAFNF